MIEILIGVLAVGNIYQAYEKWSLRREAIRRERELLNRLMARDLDQYGRVTAQLGQEKMKRGPESPPNLEDFLREAGLEPNALPVD